MPKNLMVGSHKTSNPAWDEGYARTFGGDNMRNSEGEKITDVLGRIIPAGQRCDGCPKAKASVNGDINPVVFSLIGTIFCHLMGEVIEDGVKQCGINELGN